MAKKKGVDKEKNIDDILKSHVYWAVGAGLIPVPIVDIAAVTAIQLDMLKQICSFYDINYSEEKGKTWISAIASSTMSSIVARIGASAVKSIPFIGTVVGATSMAVISGASTYALGKVFIKHFESGGTFDNLNKEKIKEFYNENLKEGKKVAKNLKERYLKLLKTPEGKEKERNIGNRLKEIADLKKAGKITEKEYEKRYQEIIKNLMDNDK
ncbi:MAG: DUF697 domain-containing protein [Bacteroidota bacterium]